MDFGLNRQARASRGRVVALFFFLGVLVGVFIGYSIGGDGRVIRVEDLPLTPETQENQ